MLSSLQIWERYIYTLIKSTPDSLQYLHLLAKNSIIQNEDTIQKFIEPKVKFMFPLPDPEHMEYLLQPEPELSDHCYLHPRNSKKK